MTVHKALLEIFYRFRLQDFESFRDCKGLWHSNRFLVLGSRPDRSGLTKTPVKEIYYVELGANVFSSGYYRRSLGIWCYRWNGGIHCTSTLLCFPRSFRGQLVCRPTWFVGYLGPQLTQVACFDTLLHAAMPLEARLKRQFGSSLPTAK